MTEIAVVGAGIGGLAAAIALRARGREVRVYEQATSLARVGAGIGQSPNAMRVLRGLGLEAILRGRGYQPRSMRNRDGATGAITSELPLGSAIEDRYGASYLLLHRADLHAALATRLPPETVALGKRLVGLDPRGEAIRLTFADGTTADAAAVVGADGVHSAVREQLFGAAAPHFTGRVGYRTTIPAAAVGDLEIDENVKWWSDDRHVILYYITAAADELYVMGTFSEPGFTLESWSARGDVVAFRAAFAAFHPTLRAVLERCPAVHKWALVDRDPLPHWSEGAVVLLGDAAHPMMPHMGQGAAMALEDAATLARCLDAEGAPADAFRRFEATRAERTAEMQAISRGNTFLRKNAQGVDWIYGYDAWTAPLAEAAGR